MVAEISEDYDERTWLSAIRVLAGWLGGLIFATLSYLAFFRASEIFSDGRFDPAAYHGVRPHGGYWHRISNPRFQHWDPPLDPKTQRAWRGERLLIRSSSRLR